MARSPRGKWSSDLFVRTVNVALAYYLLGLGAQSLTAPPYGVAAIWPAAGLALSAMLQWGGRAIPGIALGACATSLYCFAGRWSLVETWVAALATTVGAVAEASLIAYLIDRWIGHRDPFSKFRTTKTFLLCTLGGSIVSPLIGGAVITRFGLAGVWETFYTYWIWWNADVVGILFLTPLLTRALLYCSRSPAPDGQSLRDVWRAFWTIARPFLVLAPGGLMPAKRRERLLFVSLLAVTCAILFFLDRGPRLTPMVLIFLLWSTFRMGFAYSQFAAFGIAIAAAAATARGSGRSRKGPPTTPWSSFRRFSWSFRSLR